MTLLPMDMVLHIYYLQQPLFLLSYLLSNTSKVALWHVVT